jgi:hypothetical protein
MDIRGSENITDVIVSIPLHHMQRLAQQMGESLTLTDSEPSSFAALCTSCLSTAVMNSSTQILSRADDNLEIALFTLFVEFGKRAGISFVRPEGLQPAIEGTKMSSNSSALRTDSMGPNFSCPSCRAYGGALNIVQAGVRFYGDHFDSWQYLAFTNDRGVSPSIVCRDCYTFFEIKGMLKAKVGNPSSPQKIYDMLAFAAQWTQVLEQQGTEVNEHVGALLLKLWELHRP